MKLADQISLPQNFGTQVTKRLVNGQVDSDKDYSNVNSILDRKLTSK